MQCVDVGNLILIVEDDAQVRSLVTRVITRAGYDVSAVGTSADARMSIKARVPDLVLLDLGLPGGGGLDLGRWIRANFPAVGIIIVTRKIDIDDRIAGLDSGADDYVTKPFDTDELMARIRSLLRRVAGRATGAAKAPDTSPAGGGRIGEWTVDPDLCALISGVTRIKLTLTELRLLEALAERPGRTATREWLLDRLGIDENTGERVIDYHVHTLRVKLRECGIGDVITSVRGIGYVFTP